MKWKKRSLILSDPNFVRHSTSLNAQYYSNDDTDSAELHDFHSQIFTCIRVSAKQYIGARMKSESRAIHLVGVRVSSFP